MEALLEAVLAGGARNGRPRRDYVKIISRYEGDAPEGLVAATRRVVDELDDSYLEDARQYTVDLDVLQRQLELWQTYDLDEANEERISLLLGLVKGPTSPKVLRFLALVGRKGIDVVDEVSNLAYDGVGYAASPGARPHEDRIGRPTKWVATKPRVSKTLDIAPLPENTVPLKRILPLTMDAAINVFDIVWNNRKDEEFTPSRFERVWEDQVHKTYTGNVNGEIEFPGKGITNFGWMVSLRERVPKDDPATRPKKPRLNGKLLKDLKDVREPDVAADENLNDADQFRFAFLLGAFKGVEEIARKVKQNPQRLPVLLDALAKLGKFIKNAADGADVPSTAKTVASTQVALVAHAMHDVVEVSDPTREQRARAADMFRASGTRAAPSGAWSLVDGVLGIRS